MNYIKHLDGLRGLAVILVILFHSGKEIFSGGYIGVDIFFVISGFLITGVIYQKLKNNSFSFSEFYSKRIKRLIPPLIIVKIFSLIVGFYLMSPYQFFTLIDQAFYSSILFSNFYLSENSDYFSLSTLENPLMHTWSLSLEEQFYLIFPFLFIFLYYTHKNRIVLFLISFALISLLIAQWGGNLTFEKPYVEDNLFFFNQPGFASYFLPIGRFFEFLLGSASYFLSDRFKRLKISHEIISYIGFFLIFLSLILCDRNSNFPNLLTLMPVIGSILIIIFNKTKNTKINFLNYKPLLFVGTISYSLYLWHQPLFAFYRIKFSSNIPIIHILIIILISFIFASLSYLFFEKKLKKLSFDSNKVIYIYFIITLMLVSIFLFLKSNSFQEVHKIKYQNKIPFKNLNLIVDLKKNLERFEKISLLESLRLNENTEKEKILILGDSMSTNWIDAVNQSENLFRSKFKFKNLILDENCFKFLNNISYLSKSCHPYIKNFQDDLSVNQYDKIFILLRWSKKSKLTLKYLLDYLENTNSKIYLVGNAKFKNLQKFAYKIASNNSMSREKLIKEFSKTKDKRNIDISIDIKRLAQINKINFIDEYNFFCKNDLCELFDSELNLYFWDEDHLTKYGSNFLGVKLFDYLKLINSN